MLQPDRPLRLPLVVDGDFSLGDQAKDDSSLSISWLISVPTTYPRIKLDTAHRDSRQNTSIPGKFNFASSVANLSFCDEIQMLGYNGITYMDPTNALFFKDHITEDELLALARFMQESEDILQLLNFISVPGERGDHHPVFDIGGPTQVLRQYPDHTHEGETLGSNGVEASVPCTLDDVLTFNGESFTVYPNNKEGHQQKPQIIATSTVIPDHATDVDAGNKPCDSGFKPDTSSTEAKEINTLCMYDGYKVGVGRVLTDLSFHHFLHLNLIGDPCAIGEKTQGFDSQFSSDMKAFVINCVVWLANLRWLK